MSFPLLVLFTHFLVLIDNICLQKSVLCDITNKINGSQNLFFDCIISNAHIDFCLKEKGEIAFSLMHQLIPNIVNIEICFLLPEMGIITLLNFVNELV